MIGGRMTSNAPSTTSRRHFLDVILGASFLGWLVSIAYPIIRYPEATSPNRSDWANTFDAR
jgi:hypothetical protein